MCTILLHRGDQFVCGECNCLTGQLWPTHLSFRGVRWTQHAPLWRLQRARSANLPGFLKLGWDPGHHAKCWNIGEARQDLGDTLSVHLESLQRPVALLTEFLVHYYSLPTLGLLQYYLNSRLIICICGFEPVFHISSYLRSSTCANSPWIWRWPYRWWSDPVACASPHQTELLSAWGWSGRRFSSVQSWTS